MLRKKCAFKGIWLPLLTLTLALMTACNNPAPTPTPTVAESSATFGPTPSRTPIPSATSTATSIPTPTPIPALQLRLHRPAQVSALEPVSVAMELRTPPGVSADPVVHASVVDPEGFPYWTSELAPSGEGLYVASQPLRFPLEPMAGDWQLQVSVQSTLPVEGRRSLTFRPDPIPYRDLIGIPASGATMRVPRAFGEVSVVGDSVAGGRVWRYRDGEIALWWAPGPAEPLLLNNAIVMLETTHDPLLMGGQAPPRLIDTQETILEGRPAFIFYEDWPGLDGGTEGGPGEALVVQGPEDWLYVVRARALGSDAIPSLLHQVWKTFTFAERDRSN
jgi:hypothetical protein